MKVINREQKSWGWENNQETIFVKEESIEEKEIGVGTKFFKQNLLEKNQNKRYGNFNTVPSREESIQEKYGWKRTEKKDISYNWSSNSNDVSSTSFSSGTGSSNGSYSSFTTETFPIHNVNNTASETVTTATSTAADTMTTAATPYVTVAKAGYDVAKKTLEKFVSNVKKDNIPERAMEDRKSVVKDINKTSSVVTGVLVTSFSLIQSVIILLLPILIIAMLGSSISSFVSFLMSSNNSLVTVAEAELEVAEENIGGEKYKEWYGVDGNWCAMFVSYCANECGYIDSDVIPKEASVSRMWLYYLERGLFVNNDGIYEPKVGDIVFFLNNERSHVGIVTDYDSGTKIITTIEGNTGFSSTEPYHEGSRVKEKTYPLTYSDILGYGTPEYPTDEFNYEQLDTLIKNLLREDEE